MENVQGSQPPHEQPRQRSGSIVGPMLLIAIGLIFLGQNLGLLPAGFWLQIWRLWPLVLVLVGIELIFGRTGWGAAVGLLALIVVVAAVLGVVAFAPRAERLTFGDWSIGGSWSVVTDRVVEELGDARRATVDLRHGAGRLTIGALPAEEEKLLDAELTLEEGSNVDRRIDRVGDQVTVRLQDREGRNAFHVRGFPEEWNLDLSPRVQTELRVHSGASELNLDLSELAVTRLDIDMGASALALVLPQSAGHTEARIKAGAAAVDVRVPEGVAARITVKGGLSGNDVDEGRFPKVGSYYQSQGYATAKNRVNLEVDTGVSGVRIR